MKSERILIYGGKGLLGSMWREEAKCYASIVFPRSLNNLNQSGYTRQHTLDSIISDIEESGAKTILNCRALTNVEQCEKDFQLAHELNVLFPGYLADAAQKKDADLYISPLTICMANTHLRLTDRSLILWILSTTMRVLNI